MTDSSSSVSRVGVHYSLVNGLGLAVCYGQNFRRVSSNTAVIFLALKSPCGTDHEALGGMCS
eukprot:CAMPEP_0170734554 /NCGR_PEP_ID=MMETSP0437-20130122/2650_1 /TAXON_ID=0 /ORGANISM="Sexangularia sp." /LENGTH=61 /DNA_ID=CAMNT_0011072871 /DNA_START=83 /DNA_END=264 /DNA_ORIENTATION=+